MRLLVLLLFVYAVLITGCVEENYEEVEFDPDTVTVELDTIETQQ